MEKFIQESSFILNNSTLPNDYQKNISLNEKEIVDVIFKESTIGYYKNNNYTFVDCIFEGNIDISYGNLTFINCLFTNNTNITKFGSDNILFENCSFSVDIFEHRKINFGTIVFNHCSLENISFKNFGTNGIYFLDSFFNNLHIERLKILKPENDTQILDLLPFYIDINSNIKTGNITIDGVINLQNLRIGDTRNKGSYGKIELRNLNFLKDDSNSYIINDSKIKKLDIRYCTNFSNKLIFQNLNLTNLFIKNTDLGKTTFNGVVMNKLYLENVTLNDCIFNGVDFPIDYNLTKNKLTSKQLRDSYRQLKHVMDKNSNHIEANKFFEKEMYYELLYNNEEYIFKDGIIKGFIVLWKEDFMGVKSKKLGDRIILILGKIISEYGNNWISAIKVIISFAFISTILDWSYYGFINKPYIDNQIVWNSGLIISLFIFLIFVLYMVIKHLFWYILFVILLFIYISKGEIIKLFFEYLYPLYGLKLEFIQGLNALELGCLTFYKIIYAILIWHLVVALKRTTKR